MKQHDTIFRDSIISDVDDELGKLCIIVLAKLKELKVKGLLSDKEYRECIELKIKFLQNHGYNTSQWEFSESIVTLEYDR